MPGNLLQRTVTKGTATPLSVSVNVKNQITGYCYDAAGNLLREAACGSNTYTYDAENRLSTTAGVTYTYDGDGKRVKKSSGKLYWYSGGLEPIAETNLSGSLTGEYVFFGGKRIARITGGQTYYFFSDHLGTSRKVTNSSGTVCYDADYFPFGGEQQVYVNTCPQDYKFTGKERDTESAVTLTTTYNQRLSDFRWALSGAINRHRSWSRPILDSGMQQQIGLRGEPQSSSSRQVLRTPFFWWR